MPFLPDLTDARYLDEVGWFLYHEVYGRDEFESYLDERLEYSRLFVEEVLAYLGRDEAWLADKTVVSIGGGCTGDLATWPAAVKIGVDPLLYVYQKLDMLIEDAPGTKPTIHLPVSATDMPLLDACADLVVCRNALDHMPDPAAALRETHRILRPDGALFLSVDIGGKPTPDEPTVFSLESLSSLVDEWFKLDVLDRMPHAHSVFREFSVRVLARKKALPGLTLDKAEVLRAYIAKLPPDRRP